MKPTKKILEYCKKEEYKKKLDREIQKSGLFPKSILEMLEELTILYKN